jgi:hypothetical protein
MYYYNLLLNFLTKYLFILNAASDGWRVCYIGGNKFEFSNNINEKVNSDMFISKYTRAYLKNDSLYNHIKKYNLH